MADTTLRASITDVELLDAFEKKEICIYIDTYTNKKDQSTVYTQELRYVATNTPVLKKFSGYIDCTGAILFAPFDKDTRMKPGKFPKKGGGNLDEAKPTFGTKKSGTFGALMLRINDVEFPNAIADFGKRFNEKAGTPEDLHRPFAFCKKKLGSPDHPADPKKAADYAAAGDWRFTIPYRFRLVEDPKTKTMKWEAQMFKVVEYHLNPSGDGVEEVVINVTRENITNVFANNTVVNIQLALGNLTRQSATGTGVNIYFASFNANNTIIVEKPAPRGERKIDISDEAKLALAKRLAASDGGASRSSTFDASPADQDTNHPDPDDGPEHDEDSEQPPEPNDKPGATPVAPSGASLLGALAGLSVSSA